MQWIWWEVCIDHNHVTVCFLCNICSMASGYHLVKGTSVELALLWGRCHANTATVSSHQTALQSFMMKDICVDNRTLSHFLNYSRSVFKRATQTVLSIEGFVV